MYNSDLPHIGLADGDLSVAAVFDSTMNDFLQFASRFHKAGPLHVHGPITLPVTVLHIALTLVDDLTIVVTRRCFYSGRGSH